MTVRSYNSLPIYFELGSLIVADGETPTLSVLHSEEFKEEYDKLDEAERAEIVAAHEVNDTARKRPTAQARVQDVTATLQTIRHLVRGVLFFIELLF